jgi:ATP-dependent DNA helicase DinG
MKYAVLDFETTGSQAHDSIIQVGLVLIDEGQITQSYHTFVYTNQRIPYDIQQLTGITNHHLKGAPALAEVMETMIPLLDNRILVAHNASFDFGFLQRSLQQCKLPRFQGRILDTLEIVRICYPTLAGINLPMLAQHFAIVHDRPHQADSDALATAEVLLHCLGKIEQWPLLVIQRIDDVLKPYAQADLAWFFHQMRELRERQVALDTQAHRYFRRFSMAVSDWGNNQPNDDQRTYRVEPSESEFDVFYQTFKEHLRNTFEHYEERPAQDEMIAAVFESLQAARHLIVEAGTGTGKSLAYLIATLFYSLLHEQKIVVSTHTINLMEQLVSRDVPLLQELWPESFSAAIVKGRGHYLCLRKFEHTIHGGEFIPSNDMYIAAAQMIVWLNETMTGDDEELQFWQKGRDFWKLVESDSQSCLNRACPWYKKCFYHRARHEASQADLVITNHSLVFSDLQTDSKILPAYQHIVIDEAHHFEATASKHFGVEVTHAGFLNVIYRLYRDQRNGQLNPFRQRLQSFAATDLAPLSTLLDQQITHLISIKEAWEQLSDIMVLFIQTNGERSDHESEQAVYRIKPNYVPQGWDKLQLLVEQIQSGCTEVFKIFERITNTIVESEFESEFQGVLTDIGGTLQQLQRHRDAIQFFFALADPESVYWLECGARGNVKTLHYYAVPVDVSELLRTRFFEQKESVIMTSATLSVDRSFDHLTQQLGLTEASAEGKLVSLQLTSPFAYERQALVCIPADFPELKGNRADQTFIEHLVASLTSVAQVSNGRMLVLFTSNRLLRQVYERLQPACATLGIHVMGQNLTNTSRSKLTRMFREHERAILLGTSSFWEGVDIPGQALSCLAIVRLPFQPPTHPYFEARSEHLKNQNKNAFMQLAVPQAVIRFKQGFGRLIRTASDRGVVLIYDTRVITTRYGRHFLQSLPDPLIERLPTSDLPERIGTWLHGGG